MLEENIEYRGLAEIAKRLNRSQRVVMKAIRRKTDPLPAKKKLGKEYSITEKRLMEWMNL
jgi:hypothetical protein